MEICAKPGVGGYGACDISNEVKPQTAALGFRVKSGWAAAVLLTGPVRSSQLFDVLRINLSDRRLAETRQPYHAAMGKLETDTRRINRRCVWCDALRKNRLRHFWLATSKISRSGVLRSWWEARSILVRS